MTDALQIVAQTCHVLGFVGATMFTIFVLWPSIRRQNKTAERIERLVDHIEKKSIDNLF